MSVLTFRNVTQSFGAFDLFLGLGGSIPRGARIGLVGPNGIGKTTLLRILAGEASPTEGRVNIAKGTRIGYLQQEAVRAFADHQNTVYDEMLTVFADLRAQEATLRALETEMAAGNASEELLSRYGARQEAFELAGGYEYELRIQQVLTGLGFASAAHYMPLHHCSGGQKTRALLARLLLEEPDLLILDEPTNHLDVSAVEWLEDALRGWEGALLVVSHDRYFLDRACNVIWEMSRNGLEAYRGNYSAYLNQREACWARIEVTFKATIGRFLKELDYVKRNIARASTTNMAKGRLRRLTRMVKAVELGGVQILDKKWLEVSETVELLNPRWNVAEVERHIKALPNPNPRQHRLKMRLQTAQRGGNIILRTRDLRIGYPDVPLFQAEDIELKRREVAALIGDNGTGKTTFLRTLLSEIDPLGGQLRIGANLDLGYYAQAQDALNSEHTVLDEVMSRSGMLSAQARDYLARYLFRGDDVFKPLRALSGGERSRLALAFLSLQRANFLLLDEPTNHLDIPAQEVLQEALQDYGGTILMVSHDRYLIDKLATQVWELRDGRLRVYEHGYQSYLAQRETERARAKEAKMQARAAARVAPSRPLPAEVAATADADLAHAEALIAETEHALARLGEELDAATQAQEWARVRALKREFEEMQARLESLLERWESMAVA
jgi:ATP-binding cassette subfamily F protein 3